jgi:hypothetical protein
MLAKRGEWTAAEEAFYRAYKRGDARLAERARAAVIRIRAMTRR